jgi:solute carrier family 25 ornithine transporter 2/15
MVRDIFREQGVRGFYHGLVSTFAREMPGYFFFFGAYEFGREMFVNKANNGTKADIGIARTALCGGLGGVSFWLSVFPADVVKSRVQIEPNSAVAKKSFFGALAHIAKTEGFAKLYSGLGPTIIRSFFSTGALFVAVSETEKFFNRVRGVEK